MADKKKKKQQKQKQKQKQSQQVIVNIGRGGASRAVAKPQQQQPMQSMQPPPVVQYVYRDNLALNMLNNRTATATPATQQQAPQPATLVAQQQPTAVAPTPVATRANLQPTTPPPANLVARVLQNNTIHKSTNIPAQPAEKPATVEWQQVVSAKKVDDAQPLNNNVAVDQKDIPQAFRLTSKGLPYRKTREEKEAYNRYMEEVIAKKTPAERTKEETKAYNEYMNTLTKPSADETRPEETGLVQQSMDGFLVPKRRKPKKVVPIDYNDTTMDEAEVIKDDEKLNDSESDVFFSPLKKKPT